ncbi:hypothetical protein RFI_24807 [Reticulomyxa filosa]|uniref:Transmembrane protein n=1 Tax=Reticulomyxa filosa TaxID=46433 RepID=X6MEW9_RETFI|nr:hypothetical protein RFI_24807 [Reticulomyxa filosa]|eukprot:ETO12568.1 hypothetical protein RFI_24807 [Reticulomyxa filosa]
MSFLRYHFYFIQSWILEIVICAVITFKNTMTTGLGIFTWSILAINYGILLPVFMYLYCFVFLPNRSSQIFHSRNVPCLTAVYFVTFIVFAIERPIHLLSGQSAPDLNYVGLSEAWDNFIDHLFTVLLYTLYVWKVYMIRYDGIYKQTIMMKLQKMNPLFQSQNEMNNEFVEWILWHRGTLGHHWYSLVVMSILAAIVMIPIGIIDFLMPHTNHLIISVTLWILLECIILRMIRYMPGWYERFFFFLNIDE